MGTVNWLGEKVYDGSNNTNLGSSSWSGTTNSDFFIEGTNSSSDVAKATTKTSYFSGAAITSEPYDFTSTGTIGTAGLTAQLDIANIYCWMLMLGAPNTLANGGFGITVADDLATDSEGRWNVGPRPGFIGGWVAYCVHPSRDFGAVPVAGSGSWTTTGNPTQLTGVDGIGGHMDVTNSIMGNFDNIFIDAISIGTGYELQGASSVFADYSTFEETVGNRYGGIDTRAGVIFAQCQLTIGDISGANNTTFNDDGFTVVWVDINTDSQSAVEADFYKLEFTQDTGTTDVTMANGTLSAESPQEFACNFSGVNTVTFDAVNLDRARLVNLDSAVTWTLGNISNSGQIDLGGSPTLTDLAIIDPTDGLAMEVGANSELNNVSNIAFDGAGVGGAGNGALYFNTTGWTVPGSVSLNNITFANRVAGSADIVIDDTVPNGTITINVSGGDTPTVDDNRTGGIADDFVIVNAVTLTITVVDTATNPIQGAVVGVYAVSDASEILNDETNASGQVTTSTNASTDIYIRVLDSTSGSTRYIPVETVGNTGAGLSLTITLNEDEIVDP